MRFINDKGKIFGLINIFDLLFIILVFALIIPGAAFQYRHFKDRQSLEKIKRKQKYRHVYKYVKAKAYLISEVAGRIKKGDQVLDEDGNVLYEIDEIISNKPSLLKSRNERGDIELEISVDERKEYYSAGGAESRREFLGTSFDTAGDWIALPSLRTVEISLKISCLTEKDGTLIMVIERKPLLIGETIGLRSKEYFVLFTVTDIM